MTQLEQYMLKIQATKEGRFDYYIRHTELNGQNTSVKNAQGERRLFVSLVEAKEYADEWQLADPRNHAYYVYENHGFYMEDRVVYVSKLAA